MCLPLLSMADSIYVHASNEDAARSIQALDARLFSHNVPNGSTGASSRWGSLIVQLEDEAGRHQPSCSRELTPVSIGGQSLDDLLAEW